MRKLIALTVILVMLGMASTVQAGGCPQVVGSTTNIACTMTVFNDSGSTLTSGSLVTWQQGGAGNEFDRSGFPFVTTTTATDSDWTAGVLITGSCPDASLCEMVYWGPVITLIAQGTDAITVSTMAATSSVAGQAGDYGAAANTCGLGMLMEDRNPETGAAIEGDSALGWIFVNPSCQ